MNKKLQAIVFLLNLTLSITSCGDDDNGTGNMIDEPETYIFMRDGESTVSFSGQTTRILMAEEIIEALKNTAFTRAHIEAMYAHEEGADDFENTSLNSSDKNVRSKTATSSDFFSSNVAEASAIKTDFDEWITGQVDEVFPVWETDASAGVAGQILESGGGSVRYVNARGLEYNQVFSKGLIGALMVDQILNNYVSTSVLDGNTNREDNDAGMVVDGTNYTNMEHKWDEAYGYAYGTSADLANPNGTIGQDDSFLSKYIDRVESDVDFAGIDEDIYEAFKLGRTAIVARNYDVRDAQVEIIREKVSMIIAIRAVYYLQQGKIGLEASTIDRGTVFHSLSEGYGFIYSLQFTRKSDSNAPYFTRSETEEMLNGLMRDGDNGLWDVTTTTLDEISDEIVARFSFTVEEAGS